MASAQIQTVDDKMHNLLAGLFEEISRTKKNPNYPWVEPEYLNGKLQSIKVAVCKTCASVFHNPCPGGKHPITAYETYSPAEMIVSSVPVQPTASVNNEPGAIVHIDEPAVETDDSIIDLDADTRQTRQETTRSSQTEQINEAPSATNNGDTSEAKLEKLKAENKRLQAENESLGEDYDKLQEEAMRTKDDLLKATKENSKPAIQPRLEATTLRADLVEPKRVEWLWRNRIPLNKLSILTGNPDQGKSLVSLYIVSQLTRGLPMYGETNALPYGEVLLMAAEDEADDTIRPRLEVMGASLSRVHILQSVVLKDGKGKTLSEREAQLDTDVQSIEDMLKDNSNIRLVVIDPISSFLGRANMNREQEVRAVLTPLKNLAARCRVAIIAVMHLNKNSEASAIHRIGGAMAFTGVARAVWLFQEDPEDKTRHLMTRVKNNIAKSTGGLVYRTAAKPILIDGTEEYQPYVEWLGETDKTAQDVLIGGAPVGRPPEKTEDAKEWLAGFLADGDQTASDIKKAGAKVGHSWRTLHRVKVALKIVAEQHDRQWIWRLPEGAAIESNVIDLDKK